MAACRGGAVTGKSFISWALTENLMAAAASAASKTLSAQTPVVFDCHQKDSPARATT
jgi:hypothetical protein